MGNQEPKCKVFVLTPSKTLHFQRSRNPTSLSKGHKTLLLFLQLFPFGGKLNEDNRYLGIMDLIAWDDLEDEYRRHFSDVRRPARDACLVVRMLLLEHMTGLSDEALVEEVAENPSMQAFYGFTKFITEAMFDSSTLTKIRDRPGVEFF